MTNKRFASIEFKCTLGLPLSSNNGHNYTPYAGRMTVLRFMCTVILALVATFEAIASPHIVSIDAAKKIAADFIGDNVEIVKKDYASRARALSMQDTTSQPLYIFNSSAGKGFIIVSGDDRTAKILGYSDSGIFDADNIPPGLNWLLEQYQAQIKSLDGAVPVQSVSESTNWAAIEPLLTAYWHQGAPFNGLLPMNTLYNDHTSVGCVPTAIAQIVHFHKWPDRGEGIFLYTDWMGRTFDFDYENTSFNYNLINGEYNEQSPKESCDEVAKLVYACAVGMETSFDYDSGMGSGSDIAMAKRFLLENFKYSADAEILGMGNFSTDEWNEIIYKELQASRPVYMQGGSHAFVCDGYGGDKYFHFNWGWGCKENGNGYFLLSVLNPGENNYTSDLAAMINIHKREGGKEPYTYDIICNDEVVLDTVNGALMMDCGMWTNYSRYGIVEGSLYFEYVNTETLESYYEKIDNGINIAGTVPFWGPWIERHGSGVGAFLNNTNSQLAPGKYKIYPAYSVAESPIKRVRCLAGARQYINLTVNDNCECIYANSEDVVVPNARIAVDCVYSSGKTSGVNTKDGAINIEYTVKNYSDNYPFGNWTCSIINEEGVEVTKWRECPCYNKPNSESSQSLSSGIYLHPEKHQIIFFDTYGNDITEKPYYFQVEGEPHTLEITQVKYDWEYQQGELCYTFDVGIKTSHPGNIVPDLSIKLLMDGNEVFSQNVDGVDYGPLGIENGVRIFYSSAKSLGGEYQIDIYDVYGNQLKNSPFNIAIPPISVALSDTAISLKEDESYTLTAKVKPSIIPVQWNSSNSAVATVDDNGKVTAIAEGSATITAKAGDKEATCVVTVEKKIISVTGITLSQTEATLTEGESLTLTATIAPDNATDKTVAWSSSNAAVATVDNNGVVTAVAEGTATITVKAGDKEATCVVTVEKKIISVTGITLNQNEATLIEGESLTLTATIAPDNATDKTVAWSSSNAAVATVDNNGVVTAVAEGTATITVKAGDKEATCVVIVEKKAAEIVYAEIANGDYYLKNVGSGKFLTGTNDWGTQASLGEYGLSITLERLPNGKYTLDTHVANNETDHYLGSNGYIDASVAEWIITEPKSGTYALTLDGTSYWGYDGSGTVLANALTDPTQKNAQWQLVTRTELENALGKATLNNGVDATFYIQGHSFNRNHNENAAWMGEPVQGGPVHDMNAEKFNTTPLDIYQELSGMPNGYYVVEVQGFYRDNVDPNVTAERRAAGTEQLRASFYAGVYSVPLKSILDGAAAELLNGGIQTSYGWVPNSMDETASYFAQGLYINKVDAWVTDGTLRIGIRKETGEEGDWVIFDNFRLTYYGTKAPAGIGQLTIDNGQLTIYDLTGRKVADAENLKGGIYIINGQKMIIKE